jgi:hypothetical protein
MAATRKHRACDSLNAKPDQTNRRDNGREAIGCSIHTTDRLPTLSWHIVAVTSFHLNTQRTYENTAGETSLVLGAAVTFGSPAHDPNHNIYATIDLLNRTSLTKSRMCACESVKLTNGRVNQIRLAFHCAEPINMCFISIIYDHTDSIRMQLWM